MSPFLLLPRTLAKPLQWSLSWPTSSVNHARRNARAALAAQSVRRAEREDVERFLASWRADRTGHPGHAARTGHSDSAHGVPRPRRTR